MEQGTGEAWQPGGLSQGFESDDDLELRTPSEAAEQALLSLRAPPKSACSVRTLAKAAVGLAGVAAAALLLWERRHAAIGLAHANPGGSLELQELEANPTDMALAVKNWGENCWKPCKGAGECADFCGTGNACCRFGAHHDPPECSGIWSWGAYTHHTCVKPVNPVAVYHTYQDCWTGHCEKAGWCDWCGKGNACCRAGWASDPAECHSVTVWPTSLHHTCVKPNVAPLPSEVQSHTVPAVAPVPEEGVCPPGKVLAESGSCTTAQEPELMTFYMYRSQNKDKFQQENVNMASLTGELWYLHNEVVFTCPRKFNIERLVRYVVTMKNTKALWKVPNHYQFGQFVQYDSGQCTWNNSQCENLWNEYGYVVGCQPLDTTSPMLPYYQGPPAPVWYSLPGRCPSKKFEDKTPECLRTEPGGNCESPDGSPDCTWKVEAAGELTIDELSGIENYTKFCEDGNVEYDKIADKGRNTSFWDNRRSEVASQLRIETVHKLFKKKYPAYPASLPDPPCDWWR